MWTQQFVRKFPVTAALLWVFFNRKVIADTVLSFLTQKVFNKLGSKYPKQLGFLKSH